MNPESFISKTTKKAFKKSINVYYNIITIMLITGTITILCYKQNKIVLFLNTLIK